MTVVVKEEKNVSSCLESKIETSMNENHNELHRSSSSSSRGSFTLVEEELRGDGCSSKMASSPLRVMFLSSDTGGGHRASAQALIDQFRRIYKDNFVYEIVDLITDHSWPPYNSMVSWYKHLSSHPNQWKLLYKVSNTRLVEKSVKLQFQLTMERVVRDVLLKKRPHVVISVHPLMTYLPGRACASLSRETGCHLPMFTVVTDLGGGHNLWFAGHNHMEKIFIATSSSKLLDCAVNTNQVPEHKLIMSGLPIRYEFQQQAFDLLNGNRHSIQGRAWRQHIQQKLNLPSSNDEKSSFTILCMGGGEGVGSLEQIVIDIYKQLYRTSFSMHVNVTILVVCGRNDSLKQSLSQHDWAKERMDLPNHNKFRTIKKIRQRVSIMAGKRLQIAKCSPLNNNTGSDLDDTDDQSQQLDLSFQNNNNNNNGNDDQSMLTEDCDNDLSSSTKLDVEVRPLGFLTNIAEYMVAADVLVTKAGPGTIAEAAAVGLPVMLTSFLPGQEEDNIHFVVSQNQFGHYEPHSPTMAKILCSWLQDPQQHNLTTFSEKAHQASNPNAAETIVRYIGRSAMRWRETFPQNQEGSLNYN